jgi:hypothetical protein
VGGAGCGARMLLHACSNADEESGGTGLDCDFFRGMAGLRPRRNGLAVHFHAKRRGRAGKAWMRVLGRVPGAPGLDFSDLGNHRS